MRVKFIILFTGISIVFALFLQGKKKNELRIVGSNILAEITKGISDQVSPNSESVFLINPTTSDEGIASLMAGTCDVAMTSRRIRADEKVRIKQMGKQVVEVIVALDAMVFIVHPKNNIDSITREQAQDIFAGEKTNWKNVGGMDEPIKIVIRQEDGFYDLFKEYVMKQHSLTASLIHMPNAIAITQSVREINGAIGFIPYAYADSTVKVLAFAKDADIARLPSSKTIKSKVYPLSFPLFYYYFSDNAEKVQPFIDAAQSAQGQKVIQELGFTLPK